MKNIKVSRKELYFSKKKHKFKANLAKTYKNNRFFEDKIGRSIAKLNLHFWF